MLNQVLNNFKRTVIDPDSLMDIERSFKSVEEVKEMMEKHGRFIQKINKTPKIEVKEITNIFEENNYIYVELDNKDKYHIRSLEGKYEFLDEASFLFCNNLIITPNK